MTAVRLRLPWFWLVVLLAAGVLTVVTLWVSAGGVNRGEALKTGGLAAGSVVALYALWLNDRRRRVDERRIEHDEGRVADERFAKAVELLGHEADQVRVGALHALAGLARSQQRYTQIVLDVLCAYLRRPFEIPEKPDDGDGIREQQVRMTAQRLIADLLPRASDVDPPLYDLDLHGATLEFFNLAERVIGQLRMRHVRVFESIALRGTRIMREAWFTGATLEGRVFSAPETVFHDRCWFSKFTAKGIVNLDRARFLGPTKFADAAFLGPLWLRGAEFAGEPDFARAKVRLAEAHLLADGYTVEPLDGEFGLVRAPAEGYVAGQ